MYGIVGGQAVAKKLSMQIGKTVKKINGILQEYNDLPESTKCVLPAKLQFADVSSPTSKLWSLLGKQLPSTSSESLRTIEQANNFARLVARAEEESDYILADMEMLIHHYIQQSEYAHTHFLAVQDHQCSLQKKSSLSVLLHDGFYSESLAARLQSMFSAFLPHRVTCPDFFRSKLCKTTVTGVFDLDICEDVSDTECHSESDYDIDSDGDTPD